MPRASLPLPAPRAGAGLGAGLTDGCSFAVAGLAGAPAEEPAAPAPATAPKVVYRSGAPPNKNKGALVTIQDLVAKPEYNLCGGYICSYDAKTMRYNVAVMTGIDAGKKVLALKARNLLPRSM